VISDWYATHSTDAAAIAGLDLEMPGPASFLGPHLAEAVRADRVDQRVVTRMGERLLRLLDRVGLLAAASDVCRDDVDRAAVARRVCRESIVLMRNTGVLPIDRRVVRRIAVIGPAAHPGFDQGGGSAQVTSIERVSPLDGLRAALGDDVEVVYSRGCAASPTMPEIAAELLSPDGWQVEVWSENLEGEPLLRTTWRDIRFSYLGASLPGVQRSRPMRVRCTTVLTAHQSGDWRLVCRASGVTTVTVDGVTVVERTEHEQALIFFAHDVSLIDGVVALTAGQPVEVVVETSLTERYVLPHLYLGAVPPDPTAEIEDAARIARDADVAVVVVGTGREAESEGFDRPTMSLPGSQDALVAAVAVAQPHTVVVLSAGSPVSMPWTGDVAAVVQSWFGGQEAGAGLADVLLGIHDAAGRLPMTIPSVLEDVASHAGFPGDGTVVRYDEGLSTGHRWLDAHGLEPAYPFGFGLSYTSFELTDALATAGPDGVVDVALSVRNIGQREGSEVVQVYLADRRPDRPPRRLVGFVKVRLAAGETQLARVRIPARAFADWEVMAHCWRVDARTARLHIGTSSRDLPLEVTVEVAARDLHGAQR
jgi:beta-glucosidase